MLSSSHINTPESGFPTDRLIGLLDRRTRRRAETPQPGSQCWRQYSRLVSHATFELNNEILSTHGGDGVSTLSEWRGSLQRSMRSPMRLRVYELLPASIVFCDVTTVTWPYMRFHHQHQYRDISAWRQSFPLENDVVCLLTKKSLCSALPSSTLRWIRACQ